MSCRWLHCEAEATTFKLDSVECLGPLFPKLVATNSPTTRDGKDLKDMIRSVKTTLKEYPAVILDWVTQ